MEQSESIRKAAVFVERADRILFVTGAGISADSGLPTYRGLGGLYEREKTDEGDSIETALSIRTFRKRPSQAWKYIARIERACRGSKPNSAHLFLRELEDWGKQVCILTQNVDGFHRQAGSSNVIDIHGCLHTIVCPHCPFRRSVEDYSELAIPPLCPQCGNILRPDVVLFDEMLPPEKLSLLNAEVAKGFDLVFTVGTTALFPYIARPVIEAASNGIPTVEIDPNRTELSHIVEIGIRDGAAAVFRKIKTRLQENRNSAERTT